MVSAMKFAVYNDPEDGQPKMKVEAETETERRRLRGLYEELHKAQLIGLRHGRAGTGNACGSSGRGEIEELDSLNIYLQLGGGLESRRTEVLREHLKAALNVL